MLLLSLLQFHANFDAKAQASTYTPGTYGGVTYTPGTAYTPGTTSAGTAPAYMPPAYSSYSTPTIAGGGAAYTSTSSPYGAYTGAYTPSTYASALPAYGNTYGGYYGSAPVTGSSYAAAPATEMPAATYGRNLGVRSVLDRQRVLKGSFFRCLPIKTLRFPVLHARPEPQQVGPSRRSPCATVGTYPNQTLLCHINILAFSAPEVDRKLREARLPWPQRLPTAMAHSQPRRPWGSVL